MARLLSDVQLYELMLIFSPELGEADLSKKIAEVKKATEEAGGKITAEDNRGTQILAFRIKKQDRGTYFVLNFNLENREKIKELNKMLFLDNAVLRHLLMKTPVNYVFKTLGEYAAEAKEIEKLEKQAEEEKAAEEEEKAEKRRAKIAPKRTSVKPARKTKETEEVETEAPEAKEETQKAAAEEAAEETREETSEKTLAEETEKETAKEAQKKRQKEDLDELDKKLKQIMDNPDITI